MTNKIEDTFSGSVEGHLYSQVQILLKSRQTPPSECARILIIGSGFDYLSKKLCSDGHIVDRLTGASLPNNQDVRFGNRALDRAYREFSSTLPYDLIVFLNCTQKIDALNLFDKSKSLLRFGGLIIISDEFALIKAGRTFEALHSLSSFSSLAIRLGFQVLLEASFPSAGSSKIPTNVSNTTGYYQLSLHWKSNPDWRIRSVCEQDFTEFSDLFHEAFNDKISKEHWIWKYDNGRGYSIGAWKNGKLIAHHGAIGRPALIFGELAQLGFPGDVMSRKGVAKNLGRRSAFFECASTIQELYLGFGAENLLGTGFPNSHHAGRAARALGLYGEPTDRIIDLSWHPKVFNIPFSYKLVTPESYDSAASMIDCLWKSMSEDLTDRIVAIRSWKEIRRRYIDHPSRNYELFMLFDGGGGPFGLAVLRRHANKMEIMDLVGSIRDMCRMLMGARHIAAQEGATTLSGWFAERGTRSCDWKADARIRDIGVQTPSHSWISSLPFSDVKGRIWLTSGDTDFK